MTQRDTTSMTGLTRIAAGERDRVEALIGKETTRGIRISPLRSGAFAAERLYSVRSVNHHVRVFARRGENPSTYPRPEESARELREYPI